MEGKTGGKRLAAEHNKGKNQTALIIVGAVIALLLAGYLGLCAYAGGDRMPPNTVVGGAEVGGMSMTEAKTLVDTTLQQRLSALDVPFTCGGTIYHVPGTEFSYDLELLVKSASPASAPFPARGFKFLGAMMDRNGAPVSLTLDHVPAEVNRAVTEQSDADARTTWNIQDTAIVFTKGRTGRTVNQEGLMSDLMEEAETLLNAADPVEVAPVEAVISIAPPAEPDLQAIRNSLYAQVSEAYLDRESMEIVPSVTGKDLDIEAAKTALDKASDGQTFRVELLITEPQVSTEDLNESLFRDVLGEASTRVTGTSDRKMNVGVAAGFINGTVLFPGDEFSFNKACSPYTVDNGYGKATAYVNGLSKDTVAGGICQASSTLYWATLMANLETVERYAHRYEPSYIRGGLDATVYGDYGDEGSLDFRFINNTGHPIKIEASVDNSNYIHVTVLGTDTTGIHGQPYSTNRVVTQAYETIYQASAAVPQGTTQADPERTGYNGVTIETYQKLVDAEGKTVSETFLYKTKYYVRNEVILFNPDDLELWGIDPITGLRSEEAMAPSEPGEEGKPNPDPGESSAPAEPSVGEAPVPPPEVGEDPVLPPVQTETPPPAESLTPSDLPSIPPPGTIVLGQ